MSLVVFPTIYTQSLQPNSISLELKGLTLTPTFTLIIEYQFRFLMHQNQSAIFQEAFTRTVHQYFKIRLADCDKQVKNISLQHKLKSSRDHCELKQSDKCQNCIQSILVRMQNLSSRRIRKWRQQKIKKNIRSRQNLVTQSSIRDRKAIKQKQKLLGNRRAGSQECPKLIQSKFKPQFGNEKLRQLGIRGRFFKMVKVGDKQQAHNIFS